MAYRWKPNAAQRAAYREKMQERDTLNTVPSNGPIRTGCKVKFYHVTAGEIVEGEVVRHSYGSEKGQHTFTVDSKGSKILVKGRNLYPNLLSHQQGEESIKQAK